MADGYTPTSELHFVSGAVGGAVGFGIVKLASIAPAITERWPGLFRPFWHYFLPMGIIGAVVGAIIAALVAPAGRVRGSADMAGVVVGLAVSLTLLPQRPGIVALFLLTIAYGFVGFVPGSVISPLKSSPEGADDGRRGKQTEGS